MSSLRPDVLIIGIGNPLRGDDGVGPALIETLKAWGLPGTELKICDGDGLLLIEMWEGARRVILLDAVTSGAIPGTVYRFDAHQRWLPARCSFSSTHAFGLAETIELARTLDQLPAHLVIYAIEGKNFAMGTALSLEVERAVHNVVEQVVDEVKNEHGGMS